MEAFKQPDQVLFYRLTQEEEEALIQTDLLMKEFVTFTNLLPKEAFSVSQNSQIVPT